MTGGGSIRLKRHSNHVKDLLDPVVHSAPVCSCKGFKGQSRWTFELDAATVDRAFSEDEGRAARIDKIAVDELTPNELCAVDVYAFIRKIRVLKSYNV